MVSGRHNLHPFPELGCVFYEQNGENTLLLR